VEDGGPRGGLAETRGFTITDTDEGMYFAVLRHDFVPPFDEPESEPVPET
jgi:hypothetical protein